MAMISKDAARERTNQVAAAFIELTEENGHPAGVRDVADHLGIKSTQTTWKYLTIAASQGLLRYRPRRIPAFLPNTRERLPVVDRIRAICTRLAADMNEGTTLAQQILTMIEEDK